MKQLFLCLTVILTLTNTSFLSAQMTFSGVFDSSVNVSAADASSPVFGIEEFANIRFQSRFRDNKGTFFGAVNLLAVSGNYAADVMLRNPDGIIMGDNYAAGIELERLYFRLNGEYTDFSGGLLRLPFGYGQMWGSSDFLNPKNPLKPDARPRAVLGAGLSWFPHDDLKLLVFYAAPLNPILQEGEGSLFGLSADRHWEKMSIQALYSYETPDTGSSFGIHRAGFSVKADVEIGLVMDMLYTYNHEAKTELDGLSFSAGFDYTFFGGNLYVLAEYLYNGASSSTAREYGDDFSGGHYLYTGFTWFFNDFSNLNIAVISGFKEGSYTPFITFNHDIFQGATFTIMAQMPLTSDVLSGNQNISFDCTARLRLRF